MNAPHGSARRRAAPRPGGVSYALGLALATALLLPAAVAAGDREENPWFQAGREAVAQARETVGTTPRARNVVLFVGDGMGPSTVTAARILEGQLRGDPGEENLLAFERLPFTALTKVYNTNQQVPDSAGTMTALVSGVKTEAGVLGVDESVVPGDHASVAASAVPTLLEEAEDRGLATGLVTTTSVTHATPAACYAHAASRAWEDDSLLSADARKADFPDIARQLVEFDHGDGIDVVLGGGRAHFRGANAPDPVLSDVRGARYDERDLTEVWRTAGEGRRVVWTREELLESEPDDTAQLLGLFAPDDLAFEVDRDAREPSLTEMTVWALERLARHEGGFVLVVEAGRIDHGHHAGNAWRALRETIELSRAVEETRTRTRSDETLVVVTADHSHPFTIAGYPTRGNPILGKVVENDASGEPDDAALDGLGLSYTTLGYHTGPGHPGETSKQEEGPKVFPHLEAFRFEPFRGRPDLADVDTTDPRHLQEAMVPRFSGTHSGEDVALYAGGPGAPLFHGVREQSYVYHALVEALGWNAPGAPTGPEPGTPPTDADAEALPPEEAESPADGEDAS